MDHRDVANFWNGNADAWTELVRAGFDIDRDGLSAPAFLEMLPDVCACIGLEMGCGEGHNTRPLAMRGARMTGDDTAEKFVEHARGRHFQSPALPANAERVDQPAD
jgi:2-polyprenyl-3-methyl-5-hydroxy-6-metoxy-1,4-benzoquinol methylase